MPTVLIPHVAQTMLFEFFMKIKYFISQNTLSGTYSGSLQGITGDPVISKKNPSFLNACANLLASQNTKPYSLK